MTEQQDDTVHQEETAGGAATDVRRPLLLRGLPTRALLVLLVVVVLLGIWGALVEPRWIEVTHHRVALPGAPSLRIVHLTDLHSVDFGSREQEVLALTAAETPDLIVVTGDLIDTGGAYDAAERFLSGLDAPLGVYLVRGNWEHWVPHEDLPGLCRRAGVALLDNASVLPLPGLSVVGFDDAMAGTPRASALDGIPSGAFRLALFHSPAWFDRVAGRCGLALAGHAHGGQVRIPFAGPIWVPRGSGEYVDGWYERDGSRMYVSRGIGTSILPVRLNCRPEIAVVDLEPSR